MDYKELRTKIETFSLDDGDLGSQGYERVLLQLFGSCGHGKSAFINSCKYVLNDGGEFIQYAKAGEGMDCITIRRNAYELTPNITIVDNRNCMFSRDYEWAEILAQLGNFRPLNEMVEWKENFNDAISALEESELNPNVTDILVPIFIYSARVPLGEHAKEDIKCFLNNCIRMTGVIPIIVITNKTGGNFVHAEKFRQMGAEVIIAIENYTDTDNIKTLGRTYDILMVIYSALSNVRFHLDQPRDPKRDRMERKKFLLNYIHEASVREIQRKSEQRQSEIERDKNRQKEKESTLCVLQ